MFDQYGCQTIELQVKELNMSEDNDADINTKNTANVTFQNIRRKLYEIDEITS